VRQVAFCAGLVTSLGAPLYARALKIGIGKQIRKLLVFEVR
jgi:hypothetical protein